MTVPQCNPLANYHAHKTDIDKAVTRVMESGYYIMGHEDEAFEAEFASFCGVSHCIGCANGTDALELILRGLDIGIGDEVVTVANTAVATISAIQRAGASPFFVDIDTDTFTMLPEALEACFNDKSRNVKAVIAVHLFGHPVDFSKINSIADANGVYLIEDCAQAHGAAIDGKKVGSLGTAAAFSFYPTKNLGALGDGGVVTTNSDCLAEKIRSLQQYGWEQRYISSFVGINSRLDELQAALLRIKLACLEHDNNLRRKIADIYTSRLKMLQGVVVPVEKNNCHHVYHQYVLKVERRNELQAFLKECGICCAVHYPLPIHLQPAYTKFGHGDLAFTELVNDFIISLPMYPELSDDDVNSVIEAINDFYS